MLLTLAEVRVMATYYLLAVPASTEAGRQSFRNSISTIDEMTRELEAMLAERHELRQRTKVDPSTPTTSTPS